jgi:hypothetical protein
MHCQSFVHAFAWHRQGGYRLSQGNARHSAVIYKFLLIKVTDTKSIFQHLRNIACFNYASKIAGKIPKKKQQNLEYGFCTNQQK